jgi:pimeloyl-ACP methyl ester carboxylesterase
MGKSKGTLSRWATWLAMRLTGRYSSRLGGYFAARLWFTPWQVPTSERALARQKLWLAGTDPISFDVDGLVVDGYSAGRGPAVLLVHGWGERGATMGAFIEPLVQAGYRVVGIDLPGHGNTSTGQTNIFEISHTLRGVADHLGGIRALIAHSMGGYCATVALSEGLSPNSVVLISPASDVQHALEKFSFLFRLPPKASRGLRDNIERRLGADVWKRLAGVSLARAFRVPALIVHDRDDPQVDLTDSEALASAWSGARLVTTEGLGHAKIVRDQEVITRVISFMLQRANTSAPDLLTARAHHG